MKNPKIWELVITDIRERNELDMNKHGRFVPFLKGRESLFDAYGQVLDLATYLRTLIEELP